jgi:aryl-alcohol dehydrogenase-like predicted oxidoreductase
MKPAAREGACMAAPPLPPLPCRTLGRTGQEVTLFGLGGEGVLRTYGRTAEAVRVIHRALDQGVTYCDTAPAYADSVNYYYIVTVDLPGQLLEPTLVHRHSNFAG